MLCETGCSRISCRAHNSPYSVNKFWRVANRLHNRVALMQPDTVRCGSRRSPPSQNQYRSLDVSCTCASRPADKQSGTGPPAGGATLRRDWTNAKWAQERGPRCGGRTPPVAYARLVAAGGANAGQDDGSAEPRLQWAPGGRRLMDLQGNQIDCYGKLTAIRC
ncbi:unnamed protein product, partial [Iphiclides podalirius]